MYESKTRNIVLFDTPGYTVFCYFLRRKMDNHFICSALNFNKDIIGTLQLTFIPYLTYRGGLRAQIEAVRIHKKFRGKGFGKKIFKWAIKRSIDKGAHLVQLTTDKQRPDALEFYRALGFRDSHMGMKLNLLQ